MSTETVGLQTPTAERSAHSLKRSVGRRQCRDWHDHEWKEEYYGTRCQKCDLFFAHGQAPWDSEKDEHNECIEY